MGRGRGRDGGPVLDDALTADPDPPAYARRHAEHRCEVAAAAGAAQAARHERLRIELDRRDAAVAQSIGSGRAVARDFLAAIARRRARSTSQESKAWSEPVAQPGSGLPANWNRDR